MRRVQLLFKTHISSHTRHLASGKVVTVVEHEDKRAKAAKTLPKTINVDGVERPTTNSAGKPIHPTDDGVRNFWSWFGDSKVVDAEGRPLVVYHGTTSTFDAFDPDRAYIDEGIYFSDSAEEASSFAEAKPLGNAGRNVMPVYLNIKSPKLLDFGGREFPYADGIQKQIDKAKAAGHDGMILSNIREGGDMLPTTQYVAFRPVQIKSAIGNTGEFSPNDNSITKSLPLAVRITRR